MQDGLVLPRRAQSVCPPVGTIPLFYISSSLPWKNINFPMSSTGSTYDGPQTQRSKDQLLAHSNPIRNLLLSILFIGIFLVCVYLYWIIFRRRLRRQTLPTAYRELQETGKADESNCIPSKEVNCGTLSPQDSPAAEPKSRAGPVAEIVSPNAIIIGLQSHPAIDSASIKDHKKSSITTAINDVNHDHAIVGPSFEALIATHVRQTDQRERFIHDRRNIGLRHMALSQIREQQKYEKRIMLVRSSHRTT